MLVLVILLDIIFVTASQQIYSSNSVGPSCGDTKNHTNAIMCSRRNTTICFDAPEICDGRRDCDNGEDEQKCDAHTCPPSTFTCARSNRKCIQESFRCDGDNDCDSGEDEENCDSYVCPAKYFTCSKFLTGKKCVKGSYRCDGDSDCGQGEDEDDCSSYTCSSDQFACASNSSKKCIPASSRCDGRRQCDDGSDEVGCKSYTCLPEQFECFDPKKKCIPGSYRCDGGEDCSGGEDEIGCSKYECPLTKFTCHNSTRTRCVPVTSRCDGDRDCPNGEDENDCPKLQCKNNQFNCSRSNTCTSGSNRCDGDRDCADGEDEENCPKTKTFENCELLLKLLEHNIPWHLLPDWLCIVKSTSNYNTARPGGLFRISSTYWCGEGKACNMSCDALRDEDPSDDIECAKRIYNDQRFSAFPNWQTECNDKSSHQKYTTPCLPLPGEKAPKVSIGMERRNVLFVNGTSNQHISCTATGFPLPSIKWKYDKTEFPEAFTKPHEFRAFERPAKQVTLDLFFPNTRYFPENNKFECIVKNYVGEDTATFHVDIMNLELPSRFPYEIVIPVALLFIIGVVVMTILIHRKYFMKFGLSDAEIQEFIRGNPNRFNIGSNFHKDPNCQPYENKYEIMIGKLKIYGDEVLGKGEFGVIYKGMYVNVTVAVKTVVPHAEKAYLKSLMNELKVLIHIGEHPGIVSLIGAQTSELKQGVLNIAVEYCELGDLGNFLRANKRSFREESNQDYGQSAYENTEASFSVQNLINWSVQIVKAMEHLATKKVIHGDLATRNVLLYNKQTVKLTDFGLSKRLYDYTQYVKKGQVPLPWRWMAYESLTTLVFTQQSDIWSFGVTLWEIFSLGDLPYPGLAWTIDFPVQLENGLRPLKPKFADDAVYAVMMNSWNISPEKRDSWRDIYDTLVKLAILEY